MEEADLLGMDAMDDGYAGFDDDYDTGAFGSGPLDDEAPSSKKKDASRRVSFGADVKADKKRKSSLKVSLINWFV